MVPRPGVVGAFNAHVLCQRCGSDWKAVFKEGVPTLDLTVECPSCRHDTGHIVRFWRPEEETNETED